MLPPAGGRLLRNGQLRKAIGSFYTSNPEAVAAAQSGALEVVLMPHKWAEGYYNLKRWTRFKSGGHFAHMEEPQALVDDIRTHFRTLR